MTIHNIHYAIDATEEEVRNSYMLPPLDQDELDHFKKILDESAILLMETPGGHQHLCDGLHNIFVFMNKGISIETLGFSQ